MTKPKRIVNEEVLESVRSMPCICCKATPSDPHHLTTRGAGGCDVYENLMPLCRKHHTEIHAVGVGKLSWKFPVIKRWLMEHRRWDIIERMDR